MNFCPIPPVKILSQVLKSRKTWFALAQEFDEGMLQLYQDRPEDIMVILDNGAYEGCLTVAEYTRTLAMIHPKIAVLPDLILGPWRRSANLSLGFLEMVNFPQVEWMYVPQAEPRDKEGWLKALHAGAEDPRVSWIGLPRNMVTDVFKMPLARVFYAEYIRDKFPRLKVHALGMVNGYIPELPFLVQAGVESVDSSCPFNAENIDQWEIKLKEIDDACQNLLTL